MTTDIKKFLQTLPKWQKVAIQKLLQYDEIDEKIIDELTTLCKQEANNEFPDIDCSIPSSFTDKPDLKEIRLCSISEIKGINKLAPKKSLNFDNNNIVVIYGSNGSGKSGYIRLLKHACEARECTRGTLHKNVFSNEHENIIQQAKISYTKDNSSDPITYNWEVKNTCEDLRSVAIFDTSFDRVFIEKEGEVSYEPEMLLFFSKLITVCTRVSEKLNEEQQAIKEKTPNILNQNTSCGWLKHLSHKTTPNEIKQNCCFTLKNQSELEAVEKRIAEESPIDKAQQFTKQKKHVDEIIQVATHCFNNFSNENCNLIIESKKQFIFKQTAAETVAKNSFKDLPLKVRNSDIWNEIWCVVIEYKNKDQCILCGQSLSQEAKQRLAPVELFVKDKTKNQAKKAEEDFNQKISALPDILSEDYIKANIDAAGITDEDLTQKIIATFSTYREIKLNLQSSQETNLEDSIADFKQPPCCIKNLQKISQEYEKEVKKYEEDATKTKKDELQKKSNNLKEKKWLSEHETEIKNKVDCLKNIEKIGKAKKKAASNTLSKKKGELAEQLITEDFIQRFNNEIKQLGCSKIKVKLEKSKVAKGKVLHTVKLDGTNHKNLHEILSEGEKRIISIATFLADVTRNDYLTPIVFDDPISSLDQDYEEAVVQRLCKLALKKQVVIFTHRISFLTMLQDYTKKEEITSKIIAISQQHWGAGEPGEIPFYAKSPEKALNKLIHEDLAKATKIYSTDGSVTYNPLATELCTNFRNILESMIEYDLTSGVVVRYRRSINTLNKINNLAKITIEDCEIFDDLMTKYSKYLHSQPNEAPVQLPEPNEFKQDFDNLANWLAEFNKRT